jgi:hypothetical protein
MPGFDGTGPIGQGPLTGRQMGYCRQAKPAFAAGAGLGRGQGRGRGRAFRGPGAAFNDFQTYTDPEIVETLTARVEQLENELAQIKRHDANSDNQR